MNPWDLQSCQPGDRTSSVHLASEVNGGPRAGYQLVGESRDPVQALGSSGVIEGGSVPPGNQCKPAPAAAARLTVGMCSESRCLLLLPKKKKKKGPLRMMGSPSPPGLILHLCCHNSPLQQHPRSGSG